MYNHTNATRLDVKARHTHTIYEIKILVRSVLVRSVTTIEYKSSLGRCGEAEVVNQQMRIAREGFRARLNGLQEL